MSSKKNASGTTRATVPPPRSRSFLPASDDQIGAANNMRGDRLAPMTFNMPRDWHTKFKMTAVAHGMNMKDLLIESFAAWEREQERKK